MLAENQIFLLLPACVLAPKIYDFLDEYLPAAIIESDDKAGVEIVSILSDAWAVHIYNQDPAFFDFERCKLPVWLVCTIKDLSHVSRIDLNAIIDPDDVWVERDLTIIYVIARPSVISRDFQRLRGELVLRLLGADRRRISIVLVPSSGSFQRVVAAGIYSVLRSIDGTDLILPLDFSDVRDIFGGRIGLLSTYYLNGFSIDLSALFIYEDGMTDGLVMRLGTQFVFDDEWDEDDINEVCEMVFPNGVYGKFVQSYKGDYNFGFDMVLSQFSA